MVLSKVKSFNELFPLYENEHKTLLKNESGEVWDKEILKTKSYRDFTLFHLKELVRLRFIPSDWPKDFIQKTKNMTGRDLYSIGFNEKSPKSYLKWKFEDVLLDLYKFQSADELAKTDISKKLLKQYQTLCNQFKILKTEDDFEKQLKTFFVILHKISNGEPANHFEVNLKTGNIKRK